MMMVMIPFPRLEGPHFLLHLLCVVFISLQFSFLLSKWFSRRFLSCPLFATLFCVNWEKKREMRETWREEVKRRGWRNASWEKSLMTSFGKEVFKGLDFALCFLYFYKFQVRVSYFVLIWIWFFPHCLLMLVASLFFVPVTSSRDDSE